MVLVTISHLVSRLVTTNLVLHLSVVVSVVLTQQLNQQLSYTSTPTITTLFKQSITLLIGVEANRLMSDMLSDESLLVGLLMDYEQLVSPSWWNSLGIERYDFS